MSDPLENGTLREFERRFGPLVSEVPWDFRNSKMPETFDLDELEALSELGTPGPWEGEVFESARRSSKTGRPLKWKPEYGTHGFIPEVIDTDGVYGALDGPDVRLICAARNVLPLLIAELRAARGEIESLRGQLSSEEEHDESI